MQLSTAPQRRADGQASSLGVGSRWMRRASALLAVLLVVAAGSAVAARPATDPVPDVPRDVAPPIYLPLALRPPEPLTAPPLPLAAQLGGPAWDVALDGDLAYLAAGSHVLAVDLADPALPFYLGQSQPLPGLVSAVAAEDGLLYVAVSGDPRLTTTGVEPGLYVLDVADPSDPLILGRWPAPASGPVDVAVSGGIAYATTASETWVIDALDPSRPTAVTARAGGADQPGFLALADDRLLTAAGAAFELVDPVRPRQVSMLDGAGTEVALEDETALIADGAVSDGSWLTVHDVADLAAPVRAARLPWPGVADSPLTEQLGRGPSRLESVGLSAEALLVGGALEVDALDAPGDGPLGFLLTMDATRLEPAEPVGALGLPGVAMSIAPGERSAAVATAAGALEARDDRRFFESRAGLSVVDARDPAAPEALGTWATLGSHDGPLTVAAGGDVGYTVAHSDLEPGLAVLDLADPTRPWLRGFAPFPALADRVWETWAAAPPRPVAHDGHVWVHTGGELLHIDASLPDDPQLLVGPDITPVSRPALADGVLYRVESGRLVARDAASPTELPILGRSDAPVALGVERVVAHDGLAVLVRREDLALWEVSDPAAMRRLAGGERLALRWERAVPPPAPVVSEGYLYALEAGDEARLRVWDIASPALPKPLDPVPLWDGDGIVRRPADLARSGARLYVSHAEGVLAIDIGRPDRPRVVGQTPTARWRRAFFPDAARDAQLSPLPGHLLVTHPDVGASVYRRPD